MIVLFVFGFLVIYSKWFSLGTITMGWVVLGADIVPGFAGTFCVAFCASRTWSITSVAWIAGPVASTGHLGLTLVSPCHSRNLRIYKDLELCFCGLGQALLMPVWAWGEGPEAKGLWSNPGLSQARDGIGGGLSVARCLWPHTDAALSGHLGLEWHCFV